MAAERLKIPYPILVEGKYDRLRLLSIAEADIYTTDGFGIFKREEKKQLLLSLSKKTKIIVLTDSDGAGKVIRGHVSSLIPRDRLISLYVPQIPGKEKRKTAYSREGFLGVEGMERDLLYALLLPYAVGSTEKSEGRRIITKTDLYIDGLTGGECSGERRDCLAVSLGLPRGMTSNALLSALNVLLSYEEYKKAVARVLSVDTDAEGGLPMNMSNKKTGIKQRRESNCDTCEFYDYDEEYEEYVCIMKLDEDEMVRFLSGNTNYCPYYRYYDEYKSVQKQI